MGGFFIEVKESEILMGDWVRCRIRWLELKNIILLDSFEEFGYIM